MNTSTGASAGASASDLSFTDHLLCTVRKSELQDQIDARNKLSSLYAPYNDEQAQKKRKRAQNKEMSVPTSEKIQNLEERSKKVVSNLQLLS